MTVVTEGRVDARRNREIVLRTAARMFTLEGLDVPLARIAQRAGVGAGTVYRHFPSKEILVEAVLAEHVDGLAVAAGRWRAREEPGAALFGFLQEVVERSGPNSHVCDALSAEQTWPHVVLRAAAARFELALGDLLRDAHQAGAVRAQVRAVDLAAVMAGGVALRSAHRDSERGAWLVRLLLDSLRVPGTSDVVDPPAGSVTKARLFRDGSGVGSGHETGLCEVCDNPLAAATTGRPARYCGPTCRQRARRRRMRSGLLS
jgi:AcrR family transcriptional regulator